MNVHLFQNWQLYNVYIKVNNFDNNNILYYISAFIFLDNYTMSIFRTYCQNGIFFLFKINHYYNMLSYCIIVTNSLLSSIDTCKIINNTLRYCVICFIPRSVISIGTVWRWWFKVVLLAQSEFAAGLGR